MDALGDDANVPVFKCYQRMDSYAIKGHFGKQNYLATKKALAKKVRRAVPAEHIPPADMTAEEMHTELAAAGCDTTGRVAELRQRVEDTRKLTPAELAIRRRESRRAALMK
jgi:hypothetical protein